MEIAFTPLSAVETAFTCHLERLSLVPFPLTLLPGFDPPPLMGPGGYGSEHTDLEVFFTCIDDATHRLCTDPACVNSVPSTLSHTPGPCWNEELVLPVSPPIFRFSAPSTWSPLPSFWLGPEFPLGAARLSLRQEGRTSVEALVEVFFSVICV